MVEPRKKEGQKEMFYSILFATLMEKKSFVRNLFPVPANLHILLYWSAYSRAPIKTFVIEIFDIEEVSSSVNKVT